MNTHISNTDLTKAPLPPDEAGRLRAIERYKLSGAVRDVTFDRVTRMAARTFDVPIALVSIVEAEQQCFAGATGLEVAGTSRDVAFCSFAILSPEVTVVPDAAEDPRFATNPLVTGEPYIRFYAGAPLTVPGGHRLGTLCLIDTRPRALSEQERELLAEFAAVVSDLIELRVDKDAAETNRRELLRNEELLKLTVENVREGVALVDENLKLMLWNNAFIDFFGYDPAAVSVGGDAAALIGLTAMRGELGPGDPKQLVMALVESIYTTDRGMVMVRRQDGRVLDVCRQSLPGGRFIMTARDVTAERTTARLKDELVSTVSHELRTPLTAIHGAVKMLAAGAAGELPAKADRLASLAQQNAERLVTLVNNLLDLDKMQSGGLQLDATPQDMGAVAEAAVKQNQLVADQTDITLTVQRPAESVRARIDSLRLAQVVTNLVANACKFAPRGSEVAVSVAAVDGWARLTVADRGPGISPQFRERLFQRFAQQDGSLQKGHYGTGLGLAICKEIIEAHGGTIELDAAVAAGATFHVRLPLLPAD